MFDGEPTKLEVKVESFRLELGRFTIGTGAAPSRDFCFPLEGFGDEAGPDRERDEPGAGDGGRLVAALV
jgi:hypothetical protein